MKRSLVNALLVVLLVTAVISPVFTLFTRDVSASSTTISVIASNDDRDEAGTEMSTANYIYIYLRSYSNPLASSYRCSGLRFQLVGIPPGSTIAAAHLSLYRTGILDPANNMNAVIYGNDVADADDFVVEADVIGRVRTTASTSWVEDDVGNGWINSPDITDIVQEVVDRGDWVVNSDMAMLLISNTDVDKECQFYSWDKDPGVGHSPRLVVTFTFPGNKGEIGDILDEEILDSADYYYPKAIHVTGDVYLCGDAQSIGAETGVHLFTVSITALGIITAIDELYTVYTGDQCNVGGIVHVYGEVYAIVIKNHTSNNRVFTVAVDSAGDIGAAAIDDIQLSFESPATADAGHIARARGNIFAVAYTDEQADGWVKTITINNDGSIDDTPEDDWEWNTTFGRCPHLIQHSDTGRMLMTGAITSNSCYAYIFDVAIDGTITPGDSGTCGLGASFEGNLSLISSGTTSYYIYTYKGNDNDGFVHCLSVDGSGNVAGVGTSWEFNPTYASSPWNVECFDNADSTGKIFAVSYSSVAGSPGLTTFEVSNVGVLIKTLIDEKVLSVTYNRNNGCILQVSTSTYAIFAEVNNDSIRVTTVDIPCLAVETRDATNYSDTSANLSAYLVGDGGYSSFVLTFEYDETGSPYDNESDSTSITELEYDSVRITSLSAETLYYYRAKVVADGSVTTYGADKTFTTLATPTVSFDATIPGSSLSLEADDATYSTAHNASSADSVTSYYIGQRLDAGIYDIWRFCLVFDTSALPVDAVVTDGYVTLRTFVEADDDGVFDITLVYGQAIETTPTIVDYGELLSSTASRGSISSDSWGDNAVGYAYIPLNAAGLSDVSVTGNTKFGVRSSLDIVNSAPTGDEYVMTWEGDYGMYPTLSLTYYEVETPTVTTLSLSAVGSTTATLEGYLDDDGNANCQYKFEYGTVSGTYSFNTDWIGDISSDTYFDESVTGLTPGTTYYFRAACRNGGATGYGSELSFTTGLDNPSITTNSTTSTSMTTAQLNAYVNNDGGESCFVRFQYGETEEHYSSGEDNQTDIYGADGAGELRAQTFLVGVSGWTLDAVAILAYRVLVPGSLTVSIRAVDGTGNPTGANLTTGTIDADTFTTDTVGAWYYVEMTDYTLTATTEYALVLLATAGDTSNYVMWKTDTSSPGYDGTAQSLETKSGAGGWAAVTGTDCLFATFSAYSNTAWLYGYETGDLPWQVVTGFEDDATHRFRAQIYNAYNGVGSPISGLAEIFVTPSSVGNVADFLATALSGTQISLSWTPGDGSQKTLVKYKPGEFPTSVTDGDTAYLETGSSCTLGSLTPGITYYFRVWGFAPAIHWSPSPAEDIATTNAVGAADVLVPLLEIPSWWFLNPDPSKILSIPGFGIIQWQSDAIGVPIGSWCCILAALLAAFVGGMALMFTRSAMVALFAVGITCFAASMAGLSPLWIMFATIVMGLSVIYLAPAGRTS